MEQNKKLTIEQKLAIEALQNKLTLKGAADAIGISEMMLKKWMKLPEFIKKYEAACDQAAASDQVMVDASMILQNATRLAVKRLLLYMYCGRPSYEIRAALGILTYSMKVNQTNDFKTRLKALEEGLQRINKFYDK